MTEAITIEEQWRPIAGYEGIYEVSTEGRIRRSPEAPPCRSTTPGRILRPDYLPTGYARVSLHRDGKLHRETVHRLVAKAFLGVLRNQQVNHKDGNKLNNRLENLEVVTPRENVLHAWRTGLSSPLQGEASGNAKLRERDIYVIRSAAARGIPNKTLAEVFGVSEATISSIIRFDTWTHLLPGEAMKESA